MSGQKYFDTSWDFIGANTKAYTHCYHSYPAMMIPQIAERLIHRYGQGGKLLFDPYCGTGTSLLEANLQNIDAVGTDLNPLARLIAQTKTNKINLQILDLFLKEFSDYIFTLMFGMKQVAVVLPTIKNIDYWFDPSVQEKLAVIKQFIGQISDPSVQNFFKVAFSETVRESSWTRNSEFKMYRMTQGQMERFKPDVFGLMQSKLARNHKGLKALVNKTRGLGAESRVFGFNTVERVEYLERESVDLVVTSPPDGDSRTTVAYGQFSRLANEWLDVADATRVDGLLMGGKSSSDAYKFDCSVLNDVLERVSERDEKRAGEVKVFYGDYQKSIQHVAETVKKGGFACYVVGDRRVKGISLPTDEITQQFFAGCGFGHVETVVRNIPNKRMPSKNSPSNVVGALDRTMMNEFVVVMKKYG